MHVHIRIHPLTGWCVALFHHAVVSTLSLWQSRFIWVIGGYDLAYLARLVTDLQVHTHTRTNHCHANVTATRAEVWWALYVFEVEVKEKTAQSHSFRICSPSCIQLCYSYYYSSHFIDCCITTMQGIPVGPSVARVSAELICFSLGVCVVRGPGKWRVDLVWFGHALNINDLWINRSESNLLSPAACTGRRSFTTVHCNVTNVYRSTSPVFPPAKCSTV